MNKKVPEPDTFEVSLQDMREAAKFFLETPAKRIQLTKAFVGEKTAPPWLNDEVIAGLKFCGYAHDVDRPRVDGDMIATDGKGRVLVVELTERGKQFASGAPHPVVDVIGKS